MGRESMLFSSLGISRLIEFYFGRREREGEEGVILEFAILGARGLFFRCMHTRAKYQRAEFSSLEKRDGTT